jgi:hypothetical protein
MLELVEVLSSFFSNLMTIAIAIMVLVYFAYFMATLFGAFKSSKPKIARKFPIPTNQHRRFKKTFKTVKYMRRR